MIADSIIARLKERVPALGNRVEGAAALAPLIDGNELPSVTPSAFVIPLGLDAGPSTIMTGAHRQMLAVQWGVMLVIDYAGDATGLDSLPSLDGVARDIREALAGFQPDGDGVMELKRERLTRLAAGCAFYQIDFSVDEQLRILT